MAQITKGILGGFSGKVGTVIGGAWRGIDYMRSKPTRRSAAPPTAAQLDQQAKFTLTVRFTQTIGRLLELTFKNYAVRKTGRNSAASYILKHAITGIRPDFALDYSKILISRGDLSGAEGATASVGIDDRVTFAWRDNTGAGDAAATDRAVLVVHCPMLNQSVYTTTTATRASGSGILDAKAFNGFTVHTWIGFISEDGKLVSNSQYTGSLVIA